MKASHFLPLVVLSLASLLLPPQAEGADPSPVNPDYTAQVQTPDCSSMPASPKNAVEEQNKKYGGANLTKIWLDSNPTEQAAARQKISGFGFNEVIFAVHQPGHDPHYYANFSYPGPNPNHPNYGDGGRLCALNITTGAVRVLLDDPKGGVRDPVVHYDGKTILFSYRKGGQPFYHLYEIQADGTGMRQITDGTYDDIEPTYLPDDSIVFPSTRSERWVPCHDTRVATLYSCKRDGSGLRPLDADIEQNNTPCVLPDGRILYTRWEYTDRSQLVFHALWTMNQDGTNQSVLIGNTPEFGGQNRAAMLDAKPIPGTNQVVASFGPGHGLLEHAGWITVVDPSRGPDDPSGVHHLTQEAVWRNPYPLSSNCFLVANNNELAVMDGAGNAQQLYCLPPEDKRPEGKSDFPLWVNAPCPLAPRPREPILASELPTEQKTMVTVYLQNAYLGRNMDGIKPCEVKKLLILEDLPRPISFGDMGCTPISMGSTFTLHRILGTVPVEADGSAYFQMPAMRALLFTELDEHDMSVKGMQSYMAARPGENVSCIGCHEPRDEAPAAVESGPGLTQRGIIALRRPPSQIQPIADVPEVFDFPRDIQPVLDRNCVGCHDYTSTASGGPAAGGLILSGDHSAIFSTSYAMLCEKRLFAFPGKVAPYGEAKPHTIGSSGSKIMHMIDGSHYGAKLTDHDAKLLRLWIDSNGPYCGTYAGLGTGMIFPTVYGERGKPPAAFGTRCASCHQSGVMESWTNLSRPEKSLMLLAPLAKEAGGYGLCRALTNGKPGTEPVTVFKNTTDPDYQALLAPITAAAQHLADIKRFDMPGFHPREQYVREMQHDGVLPQDIPTTAVLDPYKLDQAYWRSLWPAPPSGP